MFHRIQSRLSAGAAGVLALSLFLIAPAAAQNLPDGPGKDTLQNVCSACHGIDIIITQKQARAAWKATVSEMKSKGAVATDQEFDVLVDYLVKNFGLPDAPPPAAAAKVTPTRAEMPEGPGKQVILRVCTACHQPDHFTQYRHTPDEWQVILARMGARANASKEDLETITAYMNQNYPKQEDTSKVNVNKATVEQLKTGLSFTQKEAEAIVNYRSQFGDFRDWGEMLVVLGVDGRRIEAAKDRMAF